MEATASVDLGAQSSDERKRSARGIPTPIPAKQISYFRLRTPHKISSLAGERVIENSANYCSDSLQVPKGTHFQNAGTLT